MSETSAMTDPNALLFPAFLYGDHATCRRKMKAEAKKWAKRYEERGDFPEPKLIPVPPGSVMLCSGVEADLIAFGAGARKPRWFFYLVDYLRMEVRPNPRPPREVFQPIFEAFVCRYPWGALSVATSQWDNSIVLVSRRLEAVLSFWEQLDTLRYLRHRQYSLAEFMIYYYEGTIQMWVDAPTENVREALREAMERMRNASQDEIHARMMRRLDQITDTDPELKHRDWLKSPGLIEAELAHTRETNSKWYDELRTGRDLAGLLVNLERKYPGD